MPDEPYVMPAWEDAAQVDTVNTRVCERGTKGCEVVHGADTFRRVRAKGDEVTTLARKTVACTVTVCDACGQAACWEGEFMCDQSRTAGTTEQTTVGYRCQFCGTTSPVRQWRRGGEECPKCKRIYDAVLAQDDP